MPAFAVNVWPTFVVPEIDGDVVTVGGNVTTTAVAPDVPDAEPAVFVAVSTTLSVWPTSALVTVYVLLVAPEIATQFAPFESHCCHWYVCVAGEPENVPSCSVSTWPIRAVPVIVGSAVLTGGVTIPATTPVGPEVAGTDPPPFVAVILTRACVPDPQQ